MAGKTESGSLTLGDLSILMPKHREHPAKPQKKVRTIS